MQLCSCADRLYSASSIRNRPLGRTARTVAARLAPFSLKEGRAVEGRALEGRAMARRALQGGCTTH